MEHGVRTLVPSDQRFWDSGGFAGQFNSLSELSGAVGQDFNKVRWTCGSKVTINKHNMKIPNTTVEQS